MLSHKLAQMSPGHLPLFQKSIKEENLLYYFLLKINLQLEKLKLDQAKR